MALCWLCVMLLALPGAWGACQQPPKFAFAELVTPVQESYDVWTEVAYKCNTGYVLAGGKSPVLICLPVSTWSMNPDFCIGKSCGQPPIKNGNYHYKTNLRLGATVTYTCNPGYVLVGQPSAECVLTGDNVHWDSIPSCEIVLCPPPPAIKNGQLLNGGKEFSFGMSASYSCDKNYTLVGDANIYCTMDSNHKVNWSTPIPECRVIECENPVVQNGIISSGGGTQHVFNSTVTFSCNSGYIINGSETVTCEADGTWHPALPTCDQTSGANMIIAGIFPLLLAMLIMNI